MSKEVYYRYSDRVRDGILQIDLREFPVVRHTPKGVQLLIDEVKTKFVRNSAKRKFAHPTKEEALQRFRDRKETQIKILEAQLKQARQALIWAEAKISKG